MTEPEAVIYDLDGTLVDLAVDWTAVADEVAACYRSAGRDPPGDLWAMLEGASGGGLEGTVRAVIREHECRGARRSHRLPLAAEVTDRTVPVGVCSLNCERACHIALAAHDLDGAVVAVVGRDTVEPWKPDPAPLLSIADRLDVPPARTLFVGDSDRDRRAARRASMPFRAV